MPVDVTAVIPLKAVRASKTRMASALSPADRALLLRRTFERVVEAARAASSVTGILVVVGDHVGRSWATRRGLDVLDEPPGGGLNAALAAADTHLGASATLVLPADLPLVSPEDLDVVVRALPGVPGVVVVPTGDGGTGALVRAPGGVIPPRYGSGSADAHVAEARRRGVGCTVVTVAGLALDLDQPADIEAAGGWSAVTGARTLPT
ncbi:2-phospho-L-lactate guanylyltransferase [Euzebya sp.]|uniref:2-phospho-L-lactate guanylyltransferase n=1 Tax=Euzebya sp. TaxID=1971409 RepID=UPI003511D5E0